MRSTYFRNIWAATTGVTLLALVLLGSSAAQTDVKFTDAASFYKDGKCVVCHGQKAEKKFDSAKKDEELTETVLKGKKPEKPPNMPAYEAKGITADQATALVAYMKSLK